MASNAGTISLGAGLLYSFLLSPAGSSTGASDFAQRLGRKILSPFLSALLAENRGPCVTRLAQMNSFGAMPRSSIAETAVKLSKEFENDPRVAMRFIENSSAGARESSVDLAAPQDYTETSKRLHELLDSEYAAGRISEPVYRRIGGKGQPGKPPTGGPGDEGGGRGPQSPGAGESPRSAETSGLGETPAEKPEAQRDAGPTYMGTGFGALEPLFREAKAEGDRLRAARNDALTAAKAAEAKPEQMKAGEKIRAYLTSERDLWAARTNQAIDVVTRLVLPKIKDREALGIAREFRHHPLELAAFIDGTHPFLQEVDGGPAVWEKNLAKLMPVMREAQRILVKPTARERAADAAFTNIAERDLQEGRAGGWLESRWLSDGYLPHALNPAGEGAVAKLPSTEGRAMGKVGKYFGFGERRSDRYPTMVHAVADGIVPKTGDPVRSCWLFGAMRRPLGSGDLRSDDRSEDRRAQDIHRYEPQRPRHPCHAQQQKREGGEAEAADQGQADAKQRSRPGGSGFEAAQGVEGVHHQPADGEREQEGQGGHGRRKSTTPPPASSTTRRPVACATSPGSTGAGKLPAMNSWGRVSFTRTNRGASS